MSLHIGRISPHTRRDELERVFERFGKCIVKMKDGYGFVVYDYPPNAQKALRALQGRNICGKPLTLTWSNKQPRPFKTFARLDRTYDHGPFRMRSSARGRDNGKSKRQLDLNVLPDCNTSAEQPEGHDIGLNSGEVLNEEIDYHQDHGKQYIREDKYHYGEDLLNEDDLVEPNQVGDRWDGQQHDHSNGNDIEHVMDFDRYAGYGRTTDNGNHQTVYSIGSPAEQSLQHKIASELIGEETFNHPKDSKAHQACYRCGGFGHKKHNCPHRNSPGRYISRFDCRHDDDIDRGDRGKRSLASFGSCPREKLQQDKDPQRTQTFKFKNTRRASGSGKSGRLIENRSSSIGKETDRAWEKGYEGNKRSRRRGGTPLKHNAKNARRPMSSPLHPDHSACASRSRSKSKSIMHIPRSILQSRSRSISSKARSRSKSPTSLSSPVSPGRSLASFPDNELLNLKGSLYNSNTPESKEIRVGGVVELDNSKLENRVAPMTIENAWSSAKVESELEKDQAIQGGNNDNHITPRSVPQVKRRSTPLSEKSVLADESSSLENLREIKDSQDIDAPTTADVIEPPVKADSELISGSSTSISSKEFFIVMKHYGLEPPDENERHLSADAYYGAARLWPWEIIYYRRLKKGPISIENYARRVVQNKESGIVDKYIRSSSGWGELNHLSTL